MLIINLGILNYILYDLSYILVEIKLSVSFFANILGNT